MKIIIETMDGRTIEGDTEEFTIYPRNNHNGPAFLGVGFPLGHRMFQRKDLKAILITLEDRDREQVLEVIPEPVPTLTDDIPF